MHPDHGQSPEEDIQQALNQAQNPAQGAPDTHQAPLGEVLSETKSCPLLSLRFALAKCGYMAQKYPWQATASLLIVAGCTWVCTYFGLTMLAVLVLLAVYSDE